MTGRVLARLLLGCAAAAGLFVLALDQERTVPAAGPAAPQSQVPPQSPMPRYDVALTSTVDASPRPRSTAPAPVVPLPSSDARSALESTLDRPVPEVPSEVPSELGPTHVDPLPPGASLSDPVDTESLYERAGLAPPVVAASSGPVTAEAAAVPPGQPSTVGLDEHVLPSCSGTGTDGPRVQVLYLREVDTPSRYHDVLPLIRNEIATVDDVFAVSARKTGGDLRVRWVHEDCVPVVDEVVLPDGTLDRGIENLIEALIARGYTDPDRKYLGFADARQLCGVGTYWLDDSPERNANNGYGAAYSRVDTPCWTGSTSTPAHELMHNLGGVQRSAPSSTTYGHCSDESELMCYDDGSGSPMRAVCPSSHGQLFDCRNDDYFSTAPAPGSYLDTHWNTAVSSFLDPAPVDQPEPLSESQPEPQTQSEPQPEPDPVTEPEPDASEWSDVESRGKHRARLTAMLSDTQTGEPVVEAEVLLERRPEPEERWQRITSTLATDETGTATVRVTRRAAGWYRFVFAGTSERAESASEPVFVKAGTRATVDWRRRGDRVVGRLVDLGGHAIGGERLVLQERHPGTRWRTVARRTTDDRGRVSIRQRVHRTTYFRWVYRGDSELLADWSPRVRARR